jgi:hypothetical protein
MFITITSVFNSSFFIVGQQDLPLRNLRPGWDAYPLYEIAHPPGANCIGENGDLYYVDNLNHKFLKMDEFGTHTELMSVGNLSFTDLEYQPNNNRILGVTENGFYTISSSQITLLKNYTYFKPLSEIAVNPIDDSFYCGSLFDNTDIFLFDANGNNLSTVVSNVKGCSQIILNNNQSFLYYTHTYNGTITQLNLTSSATKTMRTGIGLPGTQEVIGIGVDENDTLYSMTADGNESGFYKYYFNGTHEIMMNSKGGMGTLTWFPKLKSFVVAVSFGGCFVNYDLSKTDPEYLTPVVNSFSLVETQDGKILYGIDDIIYLINLTEPIGPTGQHEPTIFGTIPDETAFNSILVDEDDVMYTALANDSVSIFHITNTGSIEAWFTNEIIEATKSVVYDEKNHDFVVVTANLVENSSNIWRIPVEDPMNYTKILTFNQTTKTSGVLDDQGNIYVYEAFNNSLYKIPEGAFESELLTTNFVNFTDIYGPDVIIEPPLGYCSKENGIIMGRNDDLQIFLLDENERVVFAINNRGIDNAAIFQNHNQEMLCTQSTLIIKMVYGEPPPEPPPDTIGISPVFLVVAVIGITIMYVLSVKKRGKVTIKYPNNRKD